VISLRNFAQLAISSDSSCHGVETKAFAHCIEAAVGEKRAALQTAPKGELSMKLPFALLAGAWPFAGLALA